MFTRKKSDHTNIMTAELLLGIGISLRPKMSLYPHSVKGIHNTLEVCNESHTGVRFWGNVKIHIREKSLEKH